MVRAPAEPPGILAFERRERSWTPGTGIGIQRLRVSRHERLGRDHELCHRFSALRPVSERVEGRFCLVSIGIAVTHGDPPARHAHRL